VKDSTQVLIYYELLKEFIDMIEEENYFRSRIYIFISSHSSEVAREMKNKEDIVVDDL
jgi:hypothetical protein